MLLHIKRGLALHALNAQQYIMANALPWSAGQYSLLAGASPTVVNGDMMVIPLVTTPDGYTITMTSTGVPQVFSNGNVSGQHFIFDVYDWSLRKWYGVVTEYVNNNAPIMLDTQPHVITLARGVSFSLDISSYCIDADGDPITVTSVDTMFSGTTLVGNILSGTPDTPGSYPIHFVATDPAGGALTFPLFTFNVGNEVAAIIDQTLTIFKSKAGVQGPGGGGTSGVTVTLSNESYMVFCYAEGTPVDPTFAGAEGQLTVFRGDTDDTAAATLSATGTGCTGTINTATDSPVVGHPKGYYRVTGMTLDNAYLNLNVTDGSAVIARRFNVIKLRAGYEIVAVLPVSNLFDGRIVYLTTDGKLYRYKAGTGWTAAVAATDMTGQLTDAQLAAIAAAKLTGQITTTQISDNAITTPKLLAGSVTSATIAAGTIVAGDIAANTLTATEIAAGAITSNELAANAVLANNISAGAITAAKIASSNVITLSAQIANLTVQSANIADLTIGTTKIAASAISMVAAATKDFWDGTTLSLTVVHSGGQVIVHAQGYGNVGTVGSAGNTMFLKRDGTAIASGDLFLIGSNYYSWQSLIDQSTPSAGSHTYTLTTGPNVNAQAIVVTELKK